jgi:beta-glucosidase
VPWGFRKLLTHVWDKYCKQDNIPIAIYECGFSVEHEQDMSLEQIVNDTDRQDYLNQYIQVLCDATKDGINISAFYTWSLLE